MPQLFQKYNLFPSRIFQLFLDLNFHSEKFISMTQPWIPLASNNFLHKKFFRTLSNHELDSNFINTLTLIHCNPVVFCKTKVLKICSKFTGEHPCRNVILIKLLCNIIEITLRHGFSPVNLLRNFRTPFPKKNSFC